jgi:hypothetical protein
MPYASRYVVVGAVAAPDGCMERGLGVLATMLDRFHEADQHLQRAAAVEERVNAQPALARVRIAQARLMLARNGSGDRAIARQLLDDAERICTQHPMNGLLRTIAQLRGQVSGVAAAPVKHRRSLHELADAVRHGARARISTRGRAGMARLVGNGTDGELEQRFGSPLAIRSLMTAMAKGFQPSMAFGFEGDIQFEILPNRPGRGRQSAADSHWWTIHVEGTRATARHRPSDDPAITIHTSVADFVRLIAGAVNPVTMWIEKRVTIEGDLTLGNRLVELFGGEAPLDIPAELR